MVLCYSGFSVSYIMLKFCSIVAMYIINGMPAMYSIEATHVKAHA